jgi:hypothetical protein
MRALTTAVLVLAFAGCVVEPVLVPDRGATRVSGSDTKATAEVLGVQLRVDGAAWHGDPLELPELLTPVRLAIENHSGRPLRVAYEDFTLVGSSGFRYRAIAPVPGELPVSEAGGTPLRLVASMPTPSPVAHRPPPPPRHSPHRFYVAPHYRYRWPHPWVWVRPFRFDPYAYHRYGWAGRLPTDDMIAEAIPEGVLQDGGRVEGFVYFQGVARREKRVELQVSLVDAEDEKPFGELHVPLVVKFP